MNSLDDHADLGLGAEEPDMARFTRPVERIEHHEEVVAATQRRLDAAAERAWARMDSARDTDLFDMTRDLAFAAKNRADEYRHAHPKEDGPGSAATDSEAQVPPEQHHIASGETMTTIPTNPVATTPLTASFLAGTNAANDAGESLTVYVYRFNPDPEDSDAGSLLQPRIFAGTATGGLGIDLDDPISAIRFGLAIVRAGLRAAEIPAVSR
ncbi:hypothetical protein ABLE92_24405 [Gordonia sp. VNQ95]|uniref:hypothetical protein n=1 Tax=Gordonia sp. VNQ95 TaxID=3156619 RepID=UPI0032B3BC89